jgi:transposase
MARGARTEPVIQPRKSRTIHHDYDKAIYKQRNVIKHMFCRLKDWRLIATSSIATSNPSWAPLLSPLPSSGGCDGSGPLVLKLAI